jgi:hypothetical protein
VYAGAPGAMSQVAVARPHGFETAIQIQSEQPYVAVQALSRSGRRLATSPLTGSTRSRVSLFGHSAFISGGGVGGLQVGCFASKPCRLAGSLSAGSTKVATVSAQNIAANTGGVLFFRLTSRGRGLLARSRSRRLAVSASLRNTDGGAGFTRLDLVPYRTSGPAPAHSVAQGKSLRILVRTAFISSGGVGGIFAQCAGATSCHVKVSVRAAGGVLASTGSQLIAAEDCGILFFKLTTRGGQLLDRARGNDLAAVLSARSGRDSATAHISLVRYH